MKTSTIKRIVLLAAGCGGIPAAHAEDIDIYGGVGGSAVPNILFVVDSSASNDADARAPIPAAMRRSSNGKMLDMVQCALYMAIDNINSQPALSGKLNIGDHGRGPGMVPMPNPPDRTTSR